MSSSIVKKQLSLLEEAKEKRPQRRSLKSKSKDHRSILGKPNFSLITLV